MMVRLTPTLVAEMVVIDDDIIRYRVYCDQCNEWHYHGPRDGHRDLLLGFPGFAAIQLVLCSAAISVAILQSSKAPSRSSAVIFAFRAASISTKVRHEVS